MNRYIPVVLTGSIAVPKPSGSIGSQRQSVEAECIRIYPLAFDSGATRTTGLAGNTVGSILISASPPQISTCRGHYGNTALEGDDRIDRPSAQDVSFERIPAAQCGKSVDHSASKD